MTAADRRDPAAPGSSGPGPVGLGSVGLGSVGLAASRAGSWVSRLGVEGARRNAARAVAEDLARGRERAAADAAMLLPREATRDRQATTGSG
jgi:hypothetical protein